jgi:hypothetical protein
VVVALTLGLFFFVLPQRYDQLLHTPARRELIQLGLNTVAYARLILGLNLAVLILHLATAGVLFWRRSNDAIALLVSFALAMNGALFPLAVMYSTLRVELALRNLVDIVAFLSMVSSYSLLLLFPDGKFSPRWTRFLLAGWALMTFTSLFFPDSPFGLPSWPVAIQFLVLVTWSAIGMFAQVYRYRYVSTLQQQQQTKWALLGLAAAALGPIAYFLPFVIAPALTGPAVPNMLYQRMGPAFFNISFILQTLSFGFFTIITLVFPISFTIAIMRYRLWDIDVLINQALVYAALTASVALIYLSMIFVFEFFFGGLAGESRSDIVTILSTLIVTSIFTRLRKRVQEGIDRRFYRRRYDVSQTMATFSKSLQNEVDLDRLSGRMLNVVQDTLHPRNVSLWLIAQPAEAEPEEGKNV